MLSNARNQPKSTVELNHILIARVYLQIVLDWLFSILTANKVKMFIRFEDHVA